MDEQRDLEFAKYKWPLLALWVSIGLHGALLALVKIAPPRAALTPYTIDARLAPARPTHEAPLYLPDLKSPAIEEVLAYAPPPPAPLLESSALPAETSPAPLFESSPLPPAETPPVPQIEIPLAVDLHYYPARELDITPVGNLPEPVLPETLSGKVRYRLKIEADGRVSEVEPISVELPAGDETAAVMASIADMIRATHFSPGIKHGRPVRSVVLYELLINPVVVSRP